MMTSSSNAPTGRRLQVLQALKDQPTPMSINDLASELEVHPNTVRFHLDNLVQNGQVDRVEIEQRTTGRPPQLFQPVPGMDPTGPRHYQLLAKLLIQTLADLPDQRARAIKAGRAWGAARAVAMADDGSDARTDSGTADSGTAITQLVNLLDEIGFAPKLLNTAKAPQIALRHCPFLELAVDQSQIVCGLHLGIMQGAMQSWHAADTVDRLDPFVEPNICVAHLSSSGAH